MATFLQIFIMIEKLAQACVGGVNAHPLSLYIPSRTKLWVLVVNKPLSVEFSLNLYRLANDTTIDRYVNLQYYFFNM
jgi:hypothetical protein